MAAALNKKTHSVLLLPGDGIGPEIVWQAQRVLEAFVQEGTLALSLESEAVGGAAWLREGDPLPERVMEKARAADAILLGAVGAPQFDRDAPRDKRPEAALLRLRKELDLFANLRPARCFDALASASSLKAELVRGLDIVIVRELSSGVYFGEPRGKQVLPDGKTRWVDTQAYDEEEVQRIADVAFSLARERANGRANERAGEQDGKKNDKKNGKQNGLVHSADKANVMETGHFWRSVVSERHAREYSDVTLEHVLADNCAMQLVRAPKQFDVILTDNLFGDLLSDVAAMLTGSLGMLASASLGKVDAQGKQPAMYEPVHGSAPDLAGRGVANPLATILSVAMLLRLSCAREDLAGRVEDAVERVLQRGLRTADIATDDEKPVSTEEMGDAVLAELKETTQKHVNN